MGSMFLSKYSFHNSSKTFSKIIFVDFVCFSNLSARFSIYFSTFYFLDFWNRCYKKRDEICFCTLLQIKSYLFVHLERSFNTFWRFLLQKRKSFHKIIKFFILLKNGGSTVAPKSQAVNSDWTKKLTKKIRS